MKNQWIVIGLVAALSACHGPVPSGQLPSNEVRAERMSKAKFDESTKRFTDQIQLQLQPGVSLDEFVIDMANEHGVVLSLLDRVPNREIYLFEYHSKADISSVAEKLRTDQRVRRVGANYRIEVEGFSLQSTDPLQRDQWALFNRGQDIPRALAGRIGADIDFDLEMTQGSHEVVVAVVDTGIDYYHEDLAITEIRDGRRVILPGSNIWTNPDERKDGTNTDNNRSRGVSFVDDLHGYNFVHGNGDPMDDHGHGTHVAGVIGALRDNMKGIIGMNAQVSLMGVKFLSAHGGGSSWGAEQSIYYVVDMAKRFPEKRWIMNHSWGSSSRGTEEGVLDDFLFLAFEESAEAGIFNAAAAGNSAESNRFSGSFPSNYSRDLPGFVSVAASNHLDQLAEFSSYGYGMVDVAAPGVLIQSTVLNNGYAAWSGTSMATPHVAGLAALIWAQEPHLSAEAVKHRILTTADDLPQLEGLVTSGGRINVRRALENDFTVRLFDPPSVEVPYSRVSPPLKANLDNDFVMEIEYPGASQIQVCFKSIFLEDPFDWLQIYGRDFVVRDLITGRALARQWRRHRDEDLCSAPIPGDKVHIRLFTGAVPSDQAGFTGFEIERLKVQ